MGRLVSADKLLTHLVALDRAASIQMEPARGWRFVGPLGFRSRGACVVWLLARTVAKACPADQSLNVPMKDLERVREASNRHQGEQLIIA